MPPPTTSARCEVSTTSGSSGEVSRVRLIPARTSRIAFSVAPSWSSVCVHEHCSRMFTWVYWYGFRPPRFAAAWKVSVCSFGEQEATTSPSSSLPSMSAMISDCVASEHVNIVWRATSTPGSDSTAAITRSTST